ncbi:ABC transporter permease [Psychromonas aquimarina]|uniref:ABC transporter permease n=1 Tax=Psychromonas aquimarina TaxID=444919 RepID=UPI0004076A4B|nr:FtsX-like permease family protein [Psychromonas aquimarina]
MKWLKLSWLNVLRNTRRSIIAVSIIAFGSFSLIIASGYVLASFEGLRESTIQGGLGHLQLAQPGAFTDKEIDQGGFTPQKKLQLQRDIEAMPEVRLTTERILFEGLASSGDITIAVIGKGVNINKERKITLFTPIIEGGNLPNIDPNSKTETAEQIYTAVIGEILARDLKVNVGDSITLLATTSYQGINAIDVTVVGINRSGIPEYDQRSVMIPVSAAKILRDSDTVNRLVISLRSTADTGLISSRIQSSFVNIEQKTWLELFPFYSNVVSLYKNIFGVMGSVILLVVLMSVNNTMVMAIMERVAESGTLRAYGFTSRRISGLFASEGMIMGLCGALLGTVLAALVIIFINVSMFEMPPPPGRSIGYPLVLNWNIYAVTLISLAMIISCTAAAWLPARKMLKKNIIDAINHH